MFKIFELQHEREALVENIESYKRKFKEIFDRRVKNDTFLMSDIVLRWDACRDEKVKHGKFDNLWLGPFKILFFGGNNTFVLQNLEGEEIAGLVNGRFLKKFYT